ncbi:MAG: sulfatase-like hydrolase/transferase, partial [Opitutaceae bacterium]
MTLLTAASLRSLALLGAVCAGCPGFAASPTARPSVIVILTDDQGYGDLSCHGNPILETPNLDRLHAESIRFTDFHVAPVCTPTRGQLMTGVDALRNGAMNTSNAQTILRRRYPTMAEIFAANGYRTAIFGKWHLGENYPYRPQDRGFQHTLWLPGASLTGASSYWNNDCFDDVFRHNGTLRPFKGYCTDVLFSEAI